MNNFICGGYIFSSNFDSGNLHKVELVKWHEEAQPNNEAIAVELNLWTRPDCAGTEYENLNRSWFFFSIQGGDPNKVCKLNIVNLNKQAKLFSQGMHPVTRVGDTGKWERIKDSPIYTVTESDFILSFVHKPHANIATKFYYAFTFPFTYTENQTQLARYDSLYQKSEAEVDYIIQRLKVDARRSTFQRSSDQSEYDENEQNLMNELTPTIKPSSSIKIMENQSNVEIENDIYYRRELLINSVEGRRIDLLTITSFHSIQTEREHHFPELFPEPNASRCHKFKNKKVIFISSRVHPGETPSSFVLNGFLKMILDRKNRYASILRKMYVFKVVPFLNPDGVYNGCYRSDTLGHNLNRVYLTPNRQTQPSIYAVRKLIRYYHHGKDVDENPTNESIDSNATEGEILKDITDSSAVPASDTVSESEPESSNHESSEEKSSTDSNTLAATQLDANDLFSLSLPSTSSSSTQSPKTEKSNTIIFTAKTLSESESEFSVIPNQIENTVTACNDDDNGNDSFDINKNNNANAAPTKPLDDEKSADEKVVFNDKFMVELKPIAVPTYLNASNLDAMASTSKGSKLKVKKMSLKSSPHDNALIPKSVPLCRDSSNIRNSGKTSSRKDDQQNSNTVKLNAKNNNSIVNKTFGKSAASGSISNRSNAVKSQKTFSKSTAVKNINISSDFCIKDCDRKADNDSNMFLYIDLHGHASKKGIFMYGNYLPKVAEAVECMLLPRLMSMNCHHFHFDACVFSERNMYHKGKRDGLSKEGSGRVAIYKTIGLIKCYTLEGNYNTGKYVNILPPRGKEPNSRRVCTIPPKYTPATFEEVGRALGPSILDLTDSNPMSRLRNSEFHSLQGLRNALRNDIDRGSRSETSPKASSSHTKLKYLKNSTACCSSLTSDVYKENKVRLTTNKSQVSFGKKEKTTTVGSLTRKPGKVLCDVMGATPGIPPKRLKVVVNKNKSCHANESLEANAKDVTNLESAKTSFKKDQEASCSSYANVNSATAIDASTSKMSFIELPGEQTSTSFDPDVDPCCSYQILSQPSTQFNRFKYPNPIRRSGSTFLRKSVATSSLIGQPSLGQSSKLKKPANLKLIRSSGCGASVSTGMNHSTQLRSLRRSSLTKDGRRLKKKKSLKTDVALKRKKSKVF